MFSPVLIAAVVFFVLVGSWWFGW